MKGFTQLKTGSEDFHALNGLWMHICHMISFKQKVHSIVKLIKSLISDAKRLKVQDNKL